MEMKWPHLTVVLPTVLRCRAAIVSGSGWAASEEAQRRQTISGRRWEVIKHFALAWYKHRDRRYNIRRSAHKAQHSS